MSKTLTPKAAFKAADKLWKIWVIALADLAAVEKQKKKYVVDMAEWHTAAGGPVGMNSDRRTKCSVCMAGSVMAMSLDVPVTKSTDTEEFDKITARKLQAIDYLRRGQISTAYRVMDNYGTKSLQTPTAISEFTFKEEYEKNPKAWRKEAEQLSAVLQALNI